MNLTKSNVCLHFIQSKSLQYYNLQLHSYHVIVEVKYKLQTSSEESSPQKLSLPNAQMKYVEELDSTFVRIKIQYLNPFLWWVISRIEKQSKCITTASRQLSKAKRSIRDQFSLTPLHDAQQVRKFWKVQAKKNREIK